MGYFLAKRGAKTLRGRDDISIKKSLVYLGGKHGVGGYREAEDVIRTPEELGPCQGHWEPWRTPSRHGAGRVRPLSGHVKDKLRSEPGGSPGRDGAERFRDTRD